MPPAGPAPARLQRCLPQPLGWRRTPTSRRTSTTSRPGRGTCRRSHTTPSTKPADPLCCPVAVRAECRWSFRGVVCHTTPFVAFCVVFVVCRVCVACRLGLRHSRRRLLPNSHLRRGGGLGWQWEGRSPANFPSASSPRVSYPRDFSLFFRVVQVVLYDLAK